MNRDLKLTVDAEILESSFGRHWLLVKKDWHGHVQATTVQTARMLEIAIRQERRWGTLPTVRINYGIRE